MSKPKALCLLVVVASLLAFALSRVSGDALKAGISQPRLASPTDPTPEEATIPARDVVDAGHGNRSGVPRPDVAMPEPEVVATRLPDASPIHDLKTSELTLMARIVDSESNPIVGAELFLQGDTPFASSDGAGLVNKTRVIDDDFRETVLRGARRELSVIVRAPNFAAKHHHVAWDGVGGTLRLGTVVLDPGRDLHGVVRSDSGEPVAAASVEWRSWTPPGEGVGASAFRDYLKYRPGAVADADGRFVIRGVPLQWCTVRGHGPGMQSAQCDPVEVTAGFLDEVLVILPRATPRRPITGVVLLPDGRPAALATIDWEDAPRAFFGWNRLRTDEQGRFQLEFDADCVIDLRASAMDEPSYPAELLGVLPGTTDIELRLGQPEWMDITLVDGAGDAIPWCHVKLQLEERDKRRLRPKSQSLKPGGENGSAHVVRPRMHFTVEAFAQGYRRETFGPFDPSTLPDGPLLIAMHPGGTIHGMLVGAGQPVSNAAVMITKSRAGTLNFSQRLTPRELPFAILASTRASEPDATTDSAGKFAATLHNDGKHSVRILADGYPPTAFGVFDWTKELGASDLVFELQRAGALEGRVLRNAGSTVEGTIVGISDGWGIAYTCLADEEGRYRFDDLQPGSWQVRACLRTAPTRAGVVLSTGRPGESDAKVRWDCTVRSGETTTFDLDLTRAGSHRLTGVIEVGSLPPGGWTVSLGPAGSEWNFSHALASTRTDDEGRFEMAFSEGGPRLVRLTSLGWQLWQEIELVPGETEWNVQLELGSLTISRCLPDDKTPRWGHHYRQETRTGLVVQRALGLRKLSDEDVSITDIPAGRGQIRRHDSTIPWNADVPDEERWIVLLEFDVHPGQVTRIELP